MATEPPKIGRKPLIRIAVVILILLGVYSYFAGTYNEMVRLDENVQSAWGQVENQYQRRADLIPNLVNTVKGYAAHEQATFTAVLEARAKATQVVIDADHLDAVSLKRFSAAQGELSSALSRLMAVSESYPDLKSSENFVMLQSQLEGTENRIAVERKRFNEEINTYNSYIRGFPKNIIAQYHGFERRNYFEAEKEAEKAPNVSF
ncbi:LemA family protein [Tannerella forsythia]|jgi:lemA protein|uniref:LemA family protein n=1 Tax=Tannerella forsythia TaxID=28112 RepID=A0A1D3UPP0_TANFO|nr:LemA family protein [Tannerella forsythia]SCQ22196.1 LemA family protein [Tannerella forsythia]